MVKQRTTERQRDLFTHRDMDHLETTLGKITDVVDGLQWEFSDGRLLIWGLKPDDEHIEIGHPRAARAFLDAWLMGYDRGFGDRRAM